MKTLTQILILFIIYFPSINMYAIIPDSNSPVDSLKTGYIYRIVLANDYEVTGMIIKQDSTHIYINTDYESPDGKIQRISKSAIQHFESGSADLNKLSDELSKSSSLIWFNIGTGLTMIDNSYVFIPINLGLNFKVTQSSLLSFRYITNMEVRFNIFRPLRKEPKENLWDLAALYGLYTKNDNFLASISAGVSIVNGTKRTNFTHFEGEFILGTEYYEQETITAIGLPLQAQVIYKPGKSFGLGLTLFADINKKRSFYGLTLGISIGSL